jgi:hypothetical protein
MSPRIIYLGVDDSYRPQVLKRAGYSVVECRSVRHLHSTLIQFPEPAAVAIAGDSETDACEALSVVRSHCTAPTVLFQGGTHFFRASEFDFVVPPLTAPHQWLNHLASVIEENRALRTRSRMGCAVQFTA